MARGGNFWLGMIVGAAAGAVSALLYAPKRGDEMRSDVRHAANRAGTKAKDVWSDTKEQATKVAGTVADRSKQVVERGRGWSKAALPGCAKQSPPGGRPRRRSASSWSTRWKLEKSRSQRASAHSLPPTTER